MQINKIIAHTESTTLKLKTQQQNKKNQNKNRIKKIKTNTAARCKCATVFRIYIFIILLTMRYICNAKCPKTKTENKREKKAISCCEFVCGRNHRHHIGLYRTHTTQIHFFFSRYSIQLSHHSPISIIIVFGPSWKRRRT